MNTEKQKNIYETGQTPQYNGNISAIIWNSVNFSDTKCYEYSYDDINRLTDAVYTPDNNYNTDFTYDYNGNIETIERQGKKENDFGIIDNLILHYDGNQLLNVNDNETLVKQENIFSDKGSQALPDEREFYYDPNGNMIKDLNKKIENIQYNHLNLPEDIEISSDAGNHIYYTYDAAGIKLRKTAGSTTTDYVGNFIYEDNLLKYIITDYGKIAVETAGGLSQYTRQYNLTDHLGNVRVTFDVHNNNMADIVQEDSYYPFGMTMNGLDYRTRDIDKKNLYLYNGKELQEDFGLDWYDYGARFYDAQLGRFHTVDPMTELYNFQSPYVYAANDPIKFIDWRGMGPKLTREQRRKWRKALRLSTNIYTASDNDNENEGEGEGDPPTKSKTVAIDPGHGDHHNSNSKIDPGAVYGTDYEKDHALNVSNAVKKYLDAFGVNNMMTRTSDVKVNGKRIRWRLKKADGTDVFVSIHLNAAGSSASGFMVLYQNNSNQSKSLAQDIVNEQKMMNLYGNGLNSRPSGGKGSLGVLRGFKGEASVLIEVGFITNSQDRSNIRNNYDQIGKEIATGIYKYLQKQDMSILYKSNINN